jgi:hypothetical protein
MPEKIAGFFESKSINNKKNNNLYSENPLDKIVVT